MIVYQSLKWIVYSQKPPLLVERHSWFLKFPTTKTIKLTRNLITPKVMTYYYSCFFVIPTNTCEGSSLRQMRDLIQSEGLSWCNQLLFFLFKLSRKRRVVSRSQTAIRRRVGAYTASDNVLHRKSSLEK